MHRLILAFLTLTLLTSCAAAPQMAAVTPIVRQISPQEAAVIVLDATNTAAAVATQAELATATEISARATSTASWRQTQDAVAAVQTLTTLDLTRTAGQAAATEISGVKTQAAGQTATWGPPTLQAVATRAAATERALKAADAAATAEAEFRQTVRRTWTNWLVLVTCVILLALGIAAAFGVSDLLSARARLVQAQAEQHRAQAQQLLVMQYGGYLLQLGKGQRWEVMPPPQLAAPSSRAAAVPPAEGGVREVPIKVRQEVISHIPVGVPETPERERVITLLRAAVGLVGAGARYVPSAALLGMHPMEWQAGVDLLKASTAQPAYVETKAGRPKAGEAGRTKLVHPEYRTLGALLDGVRRGDVLPPPPAPAGAAAPENTQFLPNEDN